ncbi:minor capsid protein [Latilactobacillus sakei]|uniref:Minor capsid protein n=1 Tax=Latilactobacillus sakei TaxID=1599 RepID=A0AAF0GN57_LATSK|nr:minor capsid protein [Latilactobacillus sakei]WGI18563.1 minor capsid protein [Latilactobacillus sakei]
MKTPQQLMKEYADKQAKADKNNKQIKKDLKKAMDELLIFWYEFNEDFDEYTKADDARIPNRQLKAKLDKLAAQNSVKRKPVANNDDLIMYAVYIVASVAAIKVVGYVSDALSQELANMIKLGKKMYGVKGKSDVDDFLKMAFDGVNWSDRIWSNMDALRADLIKIMKQALLTHQNPITQTKYIRDKFDVARYQAERILRTESSRIMAKQGITNAHNAGFKKVVWVANSAACRICKSEDGNEYTLKEAEGKLPAHPNCRCSWAAVM